MAIVDFNEDMNIISALSDTPNDYMTAAELKGKFDEGPGKIKTFINEKIVPAIAALEGLFEDGKIKAAAISDGEIVTSMLADGAVTTAKINNSAISTDKLAAGSIITGKISSGAVTTDKIYNRAVTHSKIGENAVQSDNIIQGAITTIKIADSAVATPKIYPKAVTTAKLADGAVTVDKTDFVKTTVEDEDTSVPTGKAVKQYVDKKVIDVTNMTAADAWNAANSNYGEGGSELILYRDIQISSQMHKLCYRLSDKIEIGNSVLFQFYASYGSTIYSYGPIKFLSDSSYSWSSGTYNLQDRLTFDNVPTNGSSNPVKSDGIYDALALKAPLASPTFTGTPEAPTAPSGTNTTQIATTAFVKGEVDNARPLIINWNTDDKEGMYNAVNNTIDSYGNPQREILIKYANGTGTSVFLHYVKEAITNINVTYYFASDVDTFSESTGKITKTRHYGARIFAQSNDGITWTYRALLDSYDINAT